MNQDINLPYSPWDLLPITNPKDEQPDRMYFYENVVRHLIEDLVKWEANGIPINLDKVQELEKVVDNVLQEVHNKLRHNPLILEFLKSISGSKKKEKLEQLESKKKDYTDFIKPFDINNKIHRSYLINTYLICSNKKDMCLDEWSIKDLKKLNQIIASRFIQAVLDKDIDSSMQSHIQTSMELLAEDKCIAYNKNKVDTKITELDNVDIITLFNPGSSLQKQKLFDYYKIESETETKKGNDKWDRKELERLQKLINLLIEDKEKEDNAT
jgi:hypothetical protein